MGCAIAGAVVTPGGGSAAGDPGRRIRVAFSSIVDIGDVPSLMAHALLATQGYEVVPTFYARAQLAADALARGQADVGNGSTRTYWAAAAKGAGIATVMEQVGNGWSIVTAPGIQRCADLHARPFAMTGEGSVSTALSRSYLKRRCPGVEPRFLTIAGSEHRAAALLAGRIDGAPLELAETLYLAGRAPGQFRTLVSFADELPSVVTTGVHVNRAWAERHPGAVRDYVKTLVTVHRQVIAHPELLADEARRRLRIDPAFLPEIVAAHVRTAAWHANGRLTPAAVRDTLAFFVASADLPDGMAPERVADLGPLHHVLDEMGRR